MRLKLQMRSPENLQLREVGREYHIARVTHRSRLPSLRVSATGRMGELRLRYKVPTCPRAEPRLRPGLRFSGPRLSFSLQRWRWRGETRLPFP
jgi:hypothetical protein